MMWLNLILIIILLSVISAEKAGGSEVKKVVIIGTSISKSIEWNRKDKNDCLFEFINLSKAGANSEDAFLVLESAQVAQAYLYVIEYAINDSHTIKSNGIKHSYNVHKQIINKINNININSKISLMLLNKPIGYKYIFRSKYERYVNNYKNLAKEFGLYLFDFGRDWSELNYLQRSNMTTDGIHLYENGKEFFSKLLYEKVNDLICKQ